MPHAQSTQRRESMHTVRTREEQVLISRLVDRQGMSREAAGALVDDYKRFGRAEIDPLLMEGLDL